MGFISQIIFCLLVSALIGFLIGIFWSRQRRKEIWAKDKETLETKVRSYERDLDKTRGELRSQREEVNSLRSELASSSGKLQSRNSEIGMLEAKVKTFQTLESELAAKKSESGSLTTEVGLLRFKLAEAEAALKKPVEPDPRLLAELNTVRQRLSGKEHEVNTLLSRVKEL
ncbi:MAG: hypothetical protein L0220_32945, partial [Acidobacteria bacterium]|nr:hypothetical protein [Acidobacteriota bacterium]